MSLTELLPSIRALPRPEKQRLLELLSAELTGIRADPTLDPDAVYAVWTPFGTLGAGDVLQKLIQRERAES